MLFVGKLQKLKLWYASGGH